MDSLRTEIASLFELAEKKIKQIEYTGEDLTVVAINQLRYVAFHLLKADKTENEQEKIEELKKAKNHCERAIYDATEPGIIYLLEKFKKFQDDYKRETISDIVPDYLKYCAVANEANDFISVIADKSISDRVSHSNNRGKAQEKTQKYQDELKEIVQKTDDARPELNKKIKNNRKIVLFGIFGIFFSLVSIIISILLKCP